MNGDDTADEDDTESVLADIKAHPGNVSLNSLLDEISKLGQVRAVSVPAKAFAGIGVQVVGAWRARASASSPSHLRRFAPDARSCSPRCCSSGSGRSPTPWWSC